jgi:hypothetical protein
MFQGLKIVLKLCICHLVEVEGAVVGLEGGQVAGDVGGVEDGDGGHRGGLIIVAKLDRTVTKI